MDIIAGGVCATFPQTEIYGNEGSVEAEESLLARGLSDHRERDEEDTAEGVGGVGHQVGEEPALLAIAFISLTENCPDEVEPEEEVDQ